MRLLEDVRVLDLTNVLAGPFCCYQLATLGADVIKVEMPNSGDLARELGADPLLNKCLMGTSFLAQNAGKRSIALNLKSAAGKRVFHRLVATAQVVVENFRPGVMQRLGLDYPTLQKANPGLIYCAISGFGQDGPLKDNPAYDQIVQGLAGVMSVTGTKEGVPLRVGYPIADTIGGLTDNMTASPSGTFVTADGLLNIAANRQEQFETLCGLIGRPDLADDPHFKHRENRLVNRAMLKAEIEVALANRSAADWAAVLNAAGVPAGEILSVPEILGHPQITERGFIKRLVDTPGTQRDVTVVRAGFRLASGDPHVLTPPPELGADTRSVLKTLGMTDDEINSMQTEEIT